VADTAAWDALRARAAWTSASVGAGALLRVAMALRSRYCWICSWVRVGAALEGLAAGGMGAVAGGGAPPEAALHGIVLACGRAAIGTVGFGRAFLAAAVVEGSAGRDRLRLASPVGVEAEGGRAAGDREL
jgi:hypothetical protein